MPSIARSSRDAGEDRLLNSERVAYWFFRLNGCLTIENFIVHPDFGAGESGQKAARNYLHQLFDGEEFRWSVGIARRAGRITKVRRPPWCSRCLHRSCHLVRRRAAQWGQILTGDVADGRLKAIAWAPHNSSGPVSQAFRPRPPPMPPRSAAAR